ncbi:MAG: hypothetical protein V7742_16610 [Halioglobus sp.]
MKLGFISEMSAEPIHGGGITLSRVLGDDLREISWFAKTLLYPGQSPPQYSDRKSHVFPWWQHQKVLQKFIGDYRGHKLAIHPFIRKRFAQSVAKELLKLQPDILTTKLLVCPQADISLMVLEELKRYAEIEYVSWMMDDHLVKWENQGWVYPNGFEAILSKHLCQAKQVFVISPAMKGFYKERFGVESTVLCAPSSPAENTGVKFDNLAGQLRLVYFGSLGRWQNDALDMLLPPLKEQIVSLDVFTHNADAITSELSEAGARLHSGVPVNRVLEHASQYDALVLPISFQDGLRNMSYFNIATKFSEYLSSGVPSLVIGPSDAVMVDIVKRSKAGFVVDTNSKTQMFEILETLRDGSARREVVQSALELCAREFSLEIMRSRWLSAINALN